MRANSVSSYKNERVYCRGRDGATDKEQHRQRDEDKKEQEGERKKQRERENPREKRAAEKERQKKRKLKSKEFVPSKWNFPLYCFTRGSA